MNKQCPLVSVGIIGYGSMGSALARAMARSARFHKGFSLRVYAKGGQRPEGAEQGILFTTTLRELVLGCDIIMVAVRPEQVEAVVRDTAALLSANREPGRALLLSVAAGVTLPQLEQAAGKACAVMRVMPNTLVEADKGLFGLCPGSGITPEEKELVISLLGGLGVVIELDENRMNAFTALAGCGPGFLFHIMDSLCEAGVSVGLTREASRAIGVTLMEGCGALAASTGRHPAVLREQSTSPAGMTIAGLNHMDRTGLRGHLIDAFKTAWLQGEAMDRQGDGQREQS